jgi:hypothetical protein
MARLSILLQVLPLMAAVVLAVNLPPIPADKTTPVQQRLAVIGPCGVYIHFRSRFGWLLANMKQPCQLAGILTLNSHSHVFSTARQALASALKFAQKTPPHTVHHERTPTR